VIARLKGYNRGQVGRGVVPVSLAQVRKRHYFCVWGASTLMPTLGNDVQVFIENYGTNLRVYAVGRTV
jgi:hypothetical protein